MLVKYWMSKEVITIGPNGSMQDAIFLMKEKNIRMLPVIDKGKLVGMITQGDLKRASASDATTLEIHELLYLIDKIKIRDIMTRKLITVPIDFTIEETAEIMLENKINGVPIVDQNEKVVGVVTQSDLFRVLISLYGAGRMSIQLAFQIEDKLGNIGLLTDAIRFCGGRTTSVLSSYDSAPAGYRRVYISVHIDKNTKIDRMIEMLERISLPLYMIDRVRNIRKINSQNNESSP